MILYRLTEDCRWLDLLEGSCVTEDKFKLVFFTDKALFEPIQEFEKQDMVKYEDDEYCMLKGIECILFYTQKELEKFLEKI